MTLVTRLAEWIGRSVVATDPSLPARSIAATTADAVAGLPALSRVLLVGEAPAMVTWAGGVAALLAAHGARVTAALVPPVPPGQQVSLPVVGVEGLVRPGDHEALTALVTGGDHEAVVVPPGGLQERHVRLRAAVAAATPAHPLAVWSCAPSGTDGPTRVVDVSAVIRKKRRALAAVGVSTEGVPSREHFRTTSLGQFRTGLEVPPGLTTGW